MSEVTQCPICGAELPTLTGYMTWCHNCGWNLLSPERPAPRTRVERLYSRVGERLGDRLATALVQSKKLEPRMTLDRAAALAIAGLVFVCFAAMLALAGLLIAVAYRNPFADVLALMLLGTAFLMRPRLGKVPSEGRVSREEAPTLYRLVDEIANAIGSGKVDVIVIDHKFNATWSVVGLRRSRVLTLGLPLLTVLSSEQRVALIAHEFAHGRNGYSGRGLVIGSAVGGLEHLYVVLAPGSVGVSEVAGGELAGLAPIVNAVLWLISRPAWWLLLLEVHLVLRDHQRAEYYADLLAAQVAGAGAVIALHERLLLDSNFRALIQSAALTQGDTHAGLLDRALEHLDGIPERERERRRRAARLETARLDDTHPPTGFRIALLEQRGADVGMVSLRAEDSSAIDRELAKRRLDVERTLVDEHRDSLYIRYR
jgi:Zn-dependent protease with chaperone function